VFNAVANASWTRRKTLIFQQRHIRRLAAVTAAADPFRAALKAIAPKSVLQIVTDAGNALQSAQQTATQNEFDIINDTQGRI